MLATKCEFHEFVIDSKYLETLQIFFTNMKDNNMGTHFDNRLTVILVGLLYGTTHQPQLQRLKYTLVKDARLLLDQHDAQSK